MNSILFKKCISICLLLAIFLVAMPIAAQDAARVQVQKQEEAQPQRAAKSTQRTLVATPVASEEDALRAAIKQCGRPCKMSGAGSIAAPGGGTLDYNCNEDGDCSCFGAKDCVAMSDVCKEGTMGCNKQGCVCEEG